MTFIPHSIFVGDTCKYLHRAWSPNNFFNLSSCAVALGSDGDISLLTLKVTISHKHISIECNTRARMLRKDLSQPVGKLKYAPALLLRVITSREDVSSVEVEELRYECS